MQFEKTSKYQYKQMSNFQANRGPKMKPQLVRKSKIFLNGHCWVVFRKSTFYYSKIMVLEDSGLQKSMQINENRVRKQGPKNVCGI